MVVVVVRLWLLWSWVCAFVVVVVVRLREAVHQFGAYGVVQCVV